MRTLCHDASELESDKGELSTAEGLKLIDDIALLAPGAMLILTGGEPLIRGYLDLAGHATEKGIVSRRHKRDPHMMKLFQG